MSQLHKFFIFLGFTFLSFNFAVAQNMSGSEVYQRCHLRLARTLPSSSDSLLVAVKSGRKTAAVACLELLRLAEFDASGVMIKKADPRAIMILKTFHDFHRTYFQSRRNENLSASSYLIRDAEEAPLYLTRALFLPNAKFSSIVTLETGLQGIRERDPIRPMGTLGEFRSNIVQRYPANHPRLADDFFTVSYPSRLYYEGTMGIAYTGGTTAVIGNGTFSATVEVGVPVMDIVDSGALVGLKASSSLVLPNYYPILGNAGLKLSMIKNSQEFEANKHFGGGVVGSQAFIANNANLIQGQLPQDVTMINRRLTNRIYEDLLCHQMPSLTAADVATEVDPKSPHPFQNGASCMQCHSSIDPLAYTYRNIMNFRTNTPEQLVGLNITGMYQIPVITPSTAFYTQAPAGRIMYRRLLGGGLQKKNVNSIAEVGAALASERDLYLCAAKKYYNFLTGINVDIVRQAENAVDKRHQDEVLSLADGLQKNQDLEKMIGDIFASKTFQTRNMMTLEAQ